MRNAFKSILFCLLMFEGFTVYSQISTIFNGLVFEESLETAWPKINAISDTLRILRVDDPVFPLAEGKEEHLIALDLKLDNGTLDKVVFVFSDDKLHFIQAKGNIAKALMTSIEREGEMYLGYHVYPEDLVFVSLDNDTAWLLTPDAVHPNLFTWENPYLEGLAPDEVFYDPSVEIPEFIKMGNNMESIVPLVKAKSKFFSIDSLKQTANYSKTQINCFGVEYGGFPRKFELRFENDELVKVWILTAKGEENRIRKKLVETYGSSIFTNDKYEVFHNWTVLLRKDKPEVLILSNELGMKFKEHYEQ